MIFFAIIYNLLIITVFILRSYNKYPLEEKISPIFDLLTIPFFALFFLNIIIVSDIGRMGTILPMITFLGYDYWYRQLTKKKSRYHPEKMLKKLILYILLFYFSGMAITGYSFIVSQEDVLIVLAVFMLSIISYFYYQIIHNEMRKIENNEGLI